MTLILLPDAAERTGAVCLDGSPAGYYYRKGTAAGKWLVVFNGGGWCKGAGAQGSAVACAARAKTSLGTSKLWAKTLHEDAHGMTNTNCTINPAFCEYSVAYMYYCDGLSFSGDRAAPLEVPGGAVSPIFFRGKRIIDANIADLLTNRGMGSAATVVLSGHSAGGLATYLHADYIKTLLPSTVSNYVAVPDAGFFLDHANVYGVHLHGNEMRDAFTLGNASAVYNNDCVAKALAAQGGSSTDCIFPQHFAQYIKTSLHVTQSQYDSYQLSDILGLHCTPAAAETKTSREAAPRTLGAAAAGGEGGGGGAAAAGAAPAPCNRTMMYATSHNNCTHCTHCTHCTLLTSNLCWHADNAQFRLAL